MVVTCCHFNPDWFSNLYAENRIRFVDLIYLKKRIGLNYSVGSKFDLTNIVLISYSINPPIKKWRNLCIQIKSFLNIELKKYHLNPFASNLLSMY